MPEKLKQVSSTKLTKKRLWSSITKKSDPKN